MNEKLSSHNVPSDVVSLASIFFSAPDELGQFRQVASTDLPVPCRALLAHDDHMTVTHEAFFGSLVDVHVLDEHVEETFYTRKSLLSRQTDGAVVQYGIMQIDLAQVDTAVGHAIAEKHAPLGRVLVRNNVLRHVELVALYEIEPQEELAKCLAVPSGGLVHGRTARIHVNRRPAISLLEIVRVPEDPQP